jgi:uncharacterized membrane protein
MIGAVKKNILHRLFLTSVWIKGVAGLLETAAGFLLLVGSLRAFNQLVIFLTAPELSEDPDDWIATSLISIVAQLSPNSKLWASAYLIVHGAIKLFLVVGLLLQRLWAYPLSLWLLAMFIAYQGYRYMHTHSVWLALITIVDLVVALLIWREYQSHRLNWAKPGGTSSTTPSSAR